MQFPNLGSRARYYQVISTFYRWRESAYGLPNPIKTLKAPRIPRLILPSLSAEQVQFLIEKASCTRDQAIIALFVESGLRLSELTNIQADKIDFEAHTIQIIGKGSREALAPFGSRSEGLLRQWLSEYQPKGNIWGINKWGIVNMLRRLGKETGIKCNPHCFRRSFAVLLRLSGVDSLQIQLWGRWSGLEMVNRYTRSFTFKNSMVFYKPPLG